MLDKIIVALDFPDKEKVYDFIPMIKNDFSYVKVGMELFYSEGFAILDYLKNQDLKVFLDLKLHDIPNTVSRSLKVIDKFGIDMVNIHALGGAEMLKAARDSVVNTKLIGVTILTSHGQSDLEKLNLEGSIDKNVNNLAKLCHQAKLDGIVCSAMDLGKLDYNFDFVTPGIRLMANSGDQKRVMQPLEAIKSGASFLVMGREITQSDNIEKTIDLIKEHLND